MIWFIFAAANKPKWGFYGILLRLKRQPHCNPSSFHSYYPSCLQPERHNILLAGDVDGRSIEHHDLVQQAGRQFLLHLNLKWKEEPFSKIYFSNNFAECLSKTSCWKRRFLMQNDQKQLTESFLSSPRVFSYSYGESNWDSYLLLLYQWIE